MPTWKDAPDEPGIWIYWEDDSRDFEGDATILDLSNPMECATWQPPYHQLCQFFGPIPLPPKFIPPDPQQEQP